MADLQPITVFDFDDTLIYGDSMVSFLRLVAGWPRFAEAAALATARYLALPLIERNDQPRIARKSYFKQQMLEHVIAGRKVEDFRQSIEKLKECLRWNERMRHTLHEHYDQGHHIVIASGALDLYLPELVKDLPHHALLCTEIAVEGDRATSQMPLGNCVRERKAERTADYMVNHGPFGESWGYGNFPDDMAMLNLMKHRIII